jgi:hypothetical protein
MLLVCSVLVSTVLLVLRSSGFCVCGLLHFLLHGFNITASDRVGGSFLRNPDAELATRPMLRLYEVCVAT